MVLSGILTRATYGRERIYGHADVTAANGLERGPTATVIRTGANTHTHGKTVEEWEMQGHKRDHTNVTGAQAAAVTTQKL